MQIVLMYHTVFCMTEKTKLYWQHRHSQSEERGLVYVQVTTIN